ncbi:hypothetical protein X766_15765 [Mesorhizobium sp. LSJC255A00]|uniref:hypothetical protein n=1 Tax=Mesorhizobium sp. LSJC255A00 TaxID=1287313 RepID=UPI0003CF6460|nr:hypothetical protein [Mesorhizobium sp. LSJC255A00]ESX17862.1 hypothetical protein X766_15765 [Mesorhizobium sp. LSJC255A00]
MTSKSHFWLVSAQVVTGNKKGHENRNSMNALLNTEKGVVTRNDLARAQRAVLGRFTTSCPQIPGHEITDVFMMGISHLGEMTQEEFHAGFNDVATATAEPANQAG